jgi:hypothetical protein
LRPAWANNSGDSIFKITRAGGRRIKKNGGGSKFNYDIL